jgi:hypothetical protein
LLLLSYRAPWFRRLIHQIDLVVFISLFGERSPRMRHVQKPKPGFRISGPGGEIDTDCGF